MKRSRLQLPCKRFLYTAGAQAAMLSTLIFAWFWSLGISRILVWKNSLRDFVLYILVLFLFQAGTGKTLAVHPFWRVILPAAGIWLAVFPYVLTGSAGAWNTDFDRINPYVLTVLAGSLLLYGVLECARKIGKIWSIAFAAFLIFLLWIPPLSFAVHYAWYGSVFSGDVMLPVLLTTGEEALGFLRQQMDLGELAGAIGFLGLVLAGCYVLVHWAVRKTREMPPGGKLTKWQILLQCVIAVGMAAILIRWAP